MEIVEILGVPVSSLSKQEFLNALESAISQQGCSTVYALNAHYLNLTYRNKDYLHALRRADIGYADGASLLKAARLLGGTIKERLSTWTLWPPLCEFAAEKGYTFLLLGGEEGLAEAAKAKTEERFPGLNIVGTHHGYFDFNDRTVIDYVNELEPDFLWVGLGDPRQVLWIDKYKNDLKAKLALSAGGLFKFVAERVKRAPEGMRRRGFEWLFRASQEPILIFRYLTGLPAFGIRVLLQKFFGHRTKMRE